jgi:aminopeptidase-like protein
MNSIDLAQMMEETFDRLWPICRSISGPGLRESQDILTNIVSGNRLSFKTGESIFDWTVPKEWHARDAYLVDPNGKKRASFKDSNLHLLNYSAPFQGELDLEDLRTHLYTLPEQPDAIPYLTSYYKERWGFCLTHREYESLPAGRYKVVVDTELSNGTLDIVEIVLPGKSEKTVLFSSYLCHPSLANNELSGPIVATYLAKVLGELSDRQHTTRILISTETLGTIGYLSLRGEELKKNLVAGYVLTCIGDRGEFTYKASRRGDTLADRALLNTLKIQAPQYRSAPFDPANASDERHYCSQGFNLPVCSLMRTMYGHYPEYHTSLDNKSYIDFKNLAQSVHVLKDTFLAIDQNARFQSTQPMAEPQLGKRGLYPTLGSQKAMASQVRAQLYLLNYSDGEHDLLDISTRARVPMHDIAKAAEGLEGAQLLKRVDAREER